MTSFSLAAKSFIVKDRKLLIIRRRNDDVQKPGIWEIPGGRLEPGEDPIEGAKREVREETGLDIEVLNPISIRHFTRADNQKITLIVFLAKTAGKDITLSKEHTAFEWIPLSRCKEKLTEFFHREVDIFNKLELQKQL